MSTGVVFECSISDPLDKQPAGYKSPQDWLVRLSMDLAILCVMHVEVKTAPTDAI